MHEKYRDTNRDLCIESHNGNTKLDLQNTSMHVQSHNSHTQNHDHDTQTKYIYTTHPTVMITISFNPYIHSFKLM